VSITVNSPLLWSCVTCGSATFPLGPKALFAIDLGADAPLGQPMTISTCGLGNAFTALAWAGFGCFTIDNDNGTGAAQRRSTTKPPPGQACRVCSL
jgi:hypothetical protein